MAGMKTHKLGMKTKGIHRIVVKGGPHLHYHKTKTLKKVKA